jgi:hypothetical protein
MELRRSYFPGDALFGESCKLFPLVCDPARWSVGAKVDGKRNVPPGPGEGPTGHLGLASGAMARAPGQK